jgi:hypothetical protein
MGFEGIQLGAMIMFYTQKNLGWGQRYNVRILSVLCSAKSTCASDATLKLNPKIKINALQNRVSPETEQVFNDAFWQVIPGLYGDWRATA